MSDASTMQTSVSGWRRRIAALLVDDQVAFAQPAAREEPRFYASGDTYPSSAVTRGSEAWNMLFGPPMANGLPTPTRATAMASTAIYACTSLIAGAIMALPVNIFSVDVKTGERDRIHDDDLVWVLNEQMSPRWASSLGWEFLSCSVLFEGDAFAEIVRGPGSRPVGLKPIHPDRVWVGVTPDGARLVYRIAPEVFAGEALGEVRIVDQDDMIHVPGFGFDGRRGLSPLRYALRSAGSIALATQDYAGRFFANNARPDYALQSDQQLSPERVKQIRQEVEDNHLGTANAHRPMLLHSGMNLKTWTISNADMQLLESRQFQIEEIARAYGVPPFMIGHNEKTTSWGSGVESMGKGFVRYSLRPYLHKFEVELNRKLFRTSSRVVEFDTSDLERADTSTLMTALRTAVGRAGEKGIMNVNEARAMLRLNKAKGGDELGVNPGGFGTHPDPNQSQENAA